MKKKTVKKIIKNVVEICAYDTMSRIIVRNALFPNFGLLQMAVTVIGGSAIAFTVSDTVSNKLIKIYDDIESEVLNGSGETGN